MKLFHLSDLHIGLKLMNRDLGEDQEYIFRQIVDLAALHRPDAVVIAGDIYDRAVPSAEAVELFDLFLTLLTEALPRTAVMIISGNHDSGLRLNCFRSVLARQQVHMIGIPPQRPEDSIEKVVLQDAWGPVNFYLLPFVKPSMVKAIVGPEENGNNRTYNDTLCRLLDREPIDMSQRNVLVSHQFYLPPHTQADQVERMESEIRTVGNIDEVSGQILQVFDYAALGHIHKPMLVGDEFHRYCGTPLACSVSEAGQIKGIVMVEMEEKGGRKTSVLPLTPLRQIRLLRGTLAEVLEQASGDYVTVVLTDQTDLDIFDTQDRLRNAFPRLLEIRRETLRQADYRTSIQPEVQLDPFSLCCAFLGDTTEKEQELLQDVINTVQGVKGK